MLRLRVSMIGRHFHASMNVQTAMCKHNNTSKIRAATCVKFGIYIYNDISRFYSIQCIKYRFLIAASNSKTLNFIQVRRERSSFRENLLGRKLVGKNGFIVNSISTDSVL